MIQSLDRLVGVIDLLGGQAVRAIAGNRDAYQPVESFSFDGKATAIVGTVENHLTPVRLAECYADVGIPRLYIADLDAITSEKPQFELLEKVLSNASRFTEVFLDVGANDHPEHLASVQTLFARFDNLRLIIATESARDTSILDDYLRRIDRDRLCVSFDFREGQWMSSATTCEQWVEAVNRQEIPTAIALDLAAVGTSASDQTIDLCRRLRPKLNCPRYLTGGGIQTETQLAQLRALGCDDVLVASMFVR